ncbi:MAG: glycosyltransferase [Haloplanus sp.]
MSRDTLTVRMVSPPPSSGGIGRYADQLSDCIESQTTRVQHAPLLAGLHARDYIRTARRATSADVAHVQFEYGHFRPKLCYVWVFLPVLFALSRRRDTPVVVTVHEVWTPDTVGAIQYAYVWFVHAALAFTATKLVFMTHDARVDFRPRGLVDTCRIPHGVNIGAVQDIDPTIARAAFGLDEDDTVVSQIGYVSPRKGTETFLDLAERHPEYEFLLAGGPLREEDRPYFEMMADRAPDNVRVTGVLSDERFHQAFVATDVAVLAYRDIRQSGILNWCFAYGVPAVCRAIDRFEELVDRGAPLDLFADDGDYPTVDEAIEQSLAEMDTRRDAMRSFGAEHALSRVGRRYVDLYRSLVDGSP